MNDDPAPLQPEELDELLSADLDGELAAAAHERGSDVDAIRARIAATPDADARRDALVAARDVLADAPSLDDLAAARLRANAVRAAEARPDAKRSARRDGRKQLVLTVSGIAAAILVIAVVAAAIGRSGSSSRSTSAGLAGSAPRAALNPSIDLTRPVPDLGSYTDVAALGSVAVNTAQRRAVEHLPDLQTNEIPRELGGERSTSSRASAPVPATTAHPAPTGAQNEYPNAAGSDRTATTPPTTSKQLFAGSSVRCSPAKFAGAGEHLSMHASATLDAEPVDVYVFSGPDEHTVVVLSPTCRLVNVQTLA